MIVNANPILLSLPRVVVNDDRSIDDDFHRNKWNNGSYMDRCCRTVAEPENRRQSLYGALRREPSRIQGCLSTIEAVAEAICVLERGNGNLVRHQLRQMFQQFVARQLAFVVHRAPSTSDGATYPDTTLYYPYPDTRASSGSAMVVPPLPMSPDPPRENRTLAEPRRTVAEKDRSVADADDRNCESDPQEQPATTGTLTPREAQPQQLQQTHRTLAEPRRTIAGTNCSIRSGRRRLYILYAIGARNVRGRATWVPHGQPFEAIYDDAVALCTATNEALGSLAQR